MGSEVTNGLAKGWILQNGEVGMGRVSSTLQSVNPMLTASASSCLTQPRWCCCPILSLGKNKKLQLLTIQCFPAS